MFVSTCKGFGAELANEYMSSNIGQYGFNVVSSLELFISTKSEMEKKHNEDLIVRSFTKFISEIGKGERCKPTLGNLVYFHIFKAISALNEKEGPADYDYYKDKTGYYYDVDIPFYKRGLAKRVAGREIEKITAHK